MDGDGDDGCPGGLGDVSSGADVSSCSSDGHRSGKRCAGHGSHLDVYAAGSGVYSDQCASGDGGDVGKAGRRSPVGRRPANVGGWGHVGSAAAGHGGDAADGALAIVPAKGEGGVDSGGSASWVFVFVRSSRVEEDMRLYGSCDEPYIHLSCDGVVQGPDYRATVCDPPPDPPRGVQSTSSASSSHAVVEGHGDSRGQPVALDDGALSAPIGKGIGVLRHWHKQTNESPQHFTQTPRVRTLLSLSKQINSSVQI